MINTIFRVLDGVGRRYAKTIWTLRLKSVGKNTVFDNGVKIYNPQLISIGNNCVFNNGVTIQSCEGAEINIGDDVIISYNSILLTGSLDIKKFPEYKNHFAKCIDINSNVWIGANVTILPGVKIAKNSIIAAGSVVTKSILPNTINAGVPTKIIGKIR